MVRGIKLIIYSICEAALDIFPRHSGSFLRKKLLIFYGAKIHESSRVYSGVRVSVPKNLVLEERACLGPNVIVYNLGRVYVKKNATISQEAKLICASHNIRSSKHELVTKEIIIGENAWIGAYAIVGPYAFVEDNVIIGLGSVFKGTAENNGIYVGNPAALVGIRVLRS
jgi:putative colanic acid biosynthesis acetyltransferase WcaF